MLTNFSNERRYLAKVTTITIIDDEIADVTHINILGMTPSDSPVANLSILVEINHELLTAQTEVLKSLVQDFSDCFAASSKVCRTPIVKHRILMNETPRHQQPYRAAPKDRKATNKKVKQMLHDDFT